MADDQPEQNLFGSPLDATFAGAEQPVAPAYQPAPEPMPATDQAPTTVSPPPPAPSYPPPSYSPGYAQPGYAQPGYPQPGYAPSGYPPPGYPPPGYPPSGYPPPGAAFAPGSPGAAPAAYAYPVMPDPPKNGMSRRSIILIAVAVGLTVIAMVVAAIAAATERQPADRAVTMPDSVLGWPQLHSGHLDTLAAQRASALDSYHVFKDPHAAFFGTGSEPSLVVFTSKLSSRPSSKEVAGFFHGMASSIGRTEMDTFDPGPFGGTLECSNASIDGTPGTVCASLDSAAFIEVAEYTTDEAAVAADTREIISAAEH